MQLQLIQSLKGIDEAIHTETFNTLYVATARAFNVCSIAGYMRGRGWGGGGGVEKTHTNKNTHAKKC